MKKSTIIFSLFVLSLLCEAEQQGGKEALDSFKILVNSVDELFSSSPMILNTEDFPRSPSGKLSYRLKFEKIELSYDVQSTNSLISPFKAYIKLRLRAYSNASNGDVRSPGGERDAKTGKYIDEIWGFQDVQAAMNNQSFLTCTDAKIPNMSAKETDLAWCVGDINLLYAYQDNKWVFKDAQLPESSRIRDGQTARVLRENFLYNPEWKKVISGK